ncbi:glutamate receptor ionotropic, delta-2-like [Panulirus ornatus]|uniref:glutamate receptor ionotropic, delta-2-like n=1 Tax=Panulirus ornatus TaxID=150431 RepID=UPI003A8C6B1D
MVVEVDSFLSQDQAPPWDQPAPDQPVREQESYSQLVQRFWGDATLTCHTVLLDLSTSNTTNTRGALRLLEAAGLWKRPETRVVVVGVVAEAEALLLHPTFRNTLYALYIALQTLPSPRSDRLPFGRGSGQTEVESEGLQVYRRCEYCHSGEAGVELLFYWNLTSALPDTREIFQDQLENFMGHEFQIRSLPFFPYMDYQRDKEEIGTTVTPRDSLDVRMLNTLASTLNFTYEIREQRERVWGLEQENGSFNGIVGDLEREEADFCTLLAPTPGRIRVMGYSRLYPSDVITVTSLKPTLLPQHLALIRPFAGELWVILLVSVVLWGATLWLLHGAWRRLAGGPGLGIIPAVLFGWGVLLETPPPAPALRISGRVLVGWWLVYCLVICTAFRSSLVAHLTVQGRTRPIETFQDLVEQDSWGWGTEPWVMSGVPHEYLSSHTDPVVKKVYEKMEVLPADEGLQRVLAGGYSFIIFRNYITDIVATRYTDAQGHTPLYTSKKGLRMQASFGWGFRQVKRSVLQLKIYSCPSVQYKVKKKKKRKRITIDENFYRRGAPFQSRFNQLIWLVREAGITDQWKAEVTAKRVREKRKAAAAAEDDSAGQAATTQSESDGQVALGLHHLQGAFYLLLLGQGLALLILLWEHLVYSRSTARQMISHFLRGS